MLQINLLAGLQMRVKAHILQIWPRRRELLPCSILVLGIVVGLFLFVIRIT